MSLCGSDRLTLSPQCLVASLRDGHFGVFACNSPNVCRFYPSDGERISWWTWQVLSELLIVWSVQGLKNKAWRNFSTLVSHPVELLYIISYFANCSCTFSVCCYNLTNEKGVTCKVKRYQTKCLRQQTFWRSVHHPFPQLWALIVMRFGFSTGSLLSSSPCSSKVSHHYHMRRVWGNPDKRAKLCFYLWLLEPLIFHAHKLKRL